MATQWFQRRSRRNLLAAAGATVAGAAAATLASARAALAAGDDDQPVLVGSIFLHAQSTTHLENQANNHPIIEAVSAADGIGVYGASTSNDGVQGQSFSGAGVVGQSDSGNAVFGFNYSRRRSAILGLAFRGSTGVQGYSGSALVPPASPANTGVYGVAPNGRGVVAKGDLAPLRLVPSSALNHPTSGARGDLFVDKSGRLWFCKGSTVWVKLA